MVPQQKIDQVKDLAEKLKNSKATYLVDYQGLTGNQMVDLRNQVRKAGGKLEIAKNTLLLKATDKDLEDLTGPTMVLWAKEDQIAPLKAVAKFAKESELPKLKLGLMDDRILTAEEVEQLAKLPGFEVLRAQVVGMLSSPTSRLVWGLKGNLQKLVIALSEIQKGKN